MKKSEDDIHKMSGVKDVQVWNRTYPVSVLTEESLLVDVKKTKSMVLSLLEN